MKFEECVVAIFSDHFHPERIVGQLGLQVLVRVTVLLKCLRQRR